MGIIFFLLIFLLVRLRFSNIDSKEKRSLARSFSIVFLIYFTALMLYHYGPIHGSISQYTSQYTIYDFGELYDLDDQTGYYGTGVGIVKGYISASSAYKHRAGVYYLWNALVLVTSPFYSILWLKICNIFLFLHLLFSLYLILRKNNIAAKTTLIAFWLVAINGVFIFNSICNFKDILLSVLLLGSILLWENYLESSRSTIQKVKIVLFMVLILILVERLRIFAIFIVFAISTYYLIQISKSLGRKFALVFLLPLIFIGLIYYYNFSWIFETGKFGYISQLSGFDYGIENWADRRPELANIAGGLSYILRPAVGMVRFIFFPVPLAFLNPSLVQGVYSWRICMSFEAALVWWLIWPFSFIAVFNKEYWKNRAIIALAIWAATYLLIYSFMYLGSGASRQKIPVYMLGTVLAVIKIRELRFKKNRMYFIGVIYPILIIAALMWVFGYSA